MNNRIARKVINRISRGVYYRCTTSSAANKKSFSKPSKEILRNHLITSHSEYDIVINVQQCKCGGSINRIIEKGTFTRLRNHCFGVTKYFECTKCNGFGFNLKFFPKTKNQCCDVGYWSKKQF